MNLPMVCIVSAEHRETVRRLWEARGKGPDAFSRALCPVEPEPTESTPPTHYSMSHWTADDIEVGICQAAVSGTLPLLAEGNAYGVAGVPTEAEALAAVTTGNLTVYTAAGDDDPARFIASIFTGRGLRYVPEPEV